MKNKKINYKKSILPILAASTALYSCNSELQETECLSATDFTKDTENGFILLPINIYIGNNYSKDIAFIDSFVTNILSNHEEALAFNEDRDSILKKYKLDGINFDKDNPEIQLLFALTDDEILKAIENNDVNTYIHLLQKKGFFQTEKFKRMISLITTPHPYITRADDLEDSLFPVAICFLGVGIYVALATVAETYVMIHYGFAMYGATTEEISELITEQVTEKNVVKLWQLRGNDTHTYDITNNLHNAIIKLATDIANINNLTKEEQETIYGVLEGTINHKNIEK